MWNVVSTTLGIIAALGLSAHLAVTFLKASRRRKAAPELLYGPVKHLLTDPRYEGSGAGYPQLVGYYRDLPVRLHAVVDTLAVRKLPVLWLLVTIPAPVPVRAIFDLMMRPAAATTFSNFDSLPATIDRPPGFPEQGLIRTDNPAHLPPPFLIEPHLGLFLDPRAKELLIAPTGIRTVWQLAEADRARYGVFRQAEFGDVALSPQLVSDLLDRMISMRHDILRWAQPA